MRVYLNREEKLAAAAAGDTDKEELGFLMNDKDPAVSMAARKNPSSRNVDERQYREGHSH